MTKLPATTPICDAYGTAFAQAVISTALDLVAAARRHSYATARRDAEAVAAADAAEDAAFRKFQDFFFGASK